MPYSRHSVSILQDALGAHWASGRHTRGRKLSAFIVRMLFAAVICALLYSAIARAEEPERGAQSLQAIRTAAEQYVREAAEKAAGMPDVLFVAAAELDLRLQLTNCVNELHAFILNSTPLGARNIVGVRCSDFNGPGWTVYVPVTVEIEKPVFVMRRSVPRDAHIVADDVELKSLRLAGLGTNYVSDLTSLRDQHLKRGVAAGATLTTDSLTRDLMIKRGQEVALVFGVDGVSVRATGVALTDGGVADRIRVQNRTSLKVVEGTVESGNLVRVGL